MFQLGGCGLLGVGVWLSVSQGSFATLSPSFPSLSAANVIITLGTVVMVTGFLGCLGAIKENKCLLLSVSILQHPSCITRRRGSDFRVAGGERTGGSISELNEKHPQTDR